MDVTRAFAWMGRNSEHVKFDLTGWNFTNVKSIEGFFYDFVDACLGTSCPTAELILDGWNTSGVENMQDVFNHSFYYVKDVNLDLRGWDVSSVTNMQGMFTDIANTGKGSLTINLTGWNISNVINMDHMFSFAGCYIGEYDHPGSKISLIGLSNWNVSNVTKMGYLFSNVGLYAETVEIGNLSSWNTSNVTTMEAMFDNFGYRANKVDIGSLNVYATNIKYFAEYAASLNGIINIYSNPTSYNYAFKDAATLSGTGLTVNYASTTTNIDNIVATKSNNSNVVKGSQLN